MPSIVQVVVRGSSVLSGGWKVSGFRPLGEAKSGEPLLSAARAHIWRAGLDAAQFDSEFTVRARGWGSQSAQMGSPELFFRGQRMPMAHWPDQGFANIDTVPNVTDGRQFALGPGTLPSGLDDGARLWAFGYWALDWAGSSRSVRLLDRRRAAFELGPPGLPYGIAAGQRVRLENHLALLDRPGEWVLDEEARAIYFWPPAEMHDGDVELSRLLTLIHVKGASHVRLVGLDLRAARGTALLIEDSTDVVVEDCHVSGAGVHAIVIRGGAGNGIQRCRFADIGEEAVVLEGGDRRTLTPAGNFVRDSTFERFGLSLTSAAAIRLSGVGNVVTGNEVSNSTGGAVFFVGNDHRITHNLFHHLITELGDWGVVYTGRDWSSRGTLISDNVICAVRSNLPGGANGIYLDDTASGIAILHNSLYDVMRGMLIGGGSDNLILENLIVGGGMPIVLDARGLSWAKDKLLSPSPKGWDIPARLSVVPWMSEPYAGRYPTLPLALSGQPGTPQRNVIQGNRVIHETMGQIDPQVVNRQLLLDNVVEPSIADSELHAKFPAACFQPVADAH